MENKTAQNYNIKSRGVEITVPHENKELVFVFKQVDRGDADYGYRYSGDRYNVGYYVPLMSKIMNDDLMLPTGDYMASLYYGIYCGPKEFRNETRTKDLIENLESGGVWTGNLNLWVSKGVYVIQDRKYIEKYKNLTFDENNYFLESELVEPLVKSFEESLEDGKTIKGVRFSRNGKIRFAPSSSYFFNGDEIYEKFAKNELVIASFGIEGAEKLAEVSRKFSEPPLISDHSIYPTRRAEESYLCASAFEEMIDFHKNQRLCVNNYSFDKGQNYAFGVLKTLE